MSNTVSDLCLVFDKRQEDVGLAGSRRTRRTRRTSSPQRLHRGPHPTTTRSSPRVVRSPPASAPLRARLGAAPPCARRATRTAAPRAEAVYCSAARASRLRLRVAPGSGQPAAPSALRGGRTLRLRRLSLAALRIHSLRSGRGLTGVNLCAGRVGPSLRRALRYGRRAAAFPCSSTGGGGVWRPLATLTAGAGGASEPRRATGAPA